MNVLPHPIPYQGSKRRLVPKILPFLPTEIATYREPFCGSAALALAVASTHRAERILLNDSLVPLAALWTRLLEAPAALADRYEALWHAQGEDSRAHYERVRADFNATGEPDLLLYLLARCVKSAVRFNRQGAFNQSADLRRKGARPETMRRHILGASTLLAPRTSVRAGDYGGVLREAGPHDLVYLDPPYVGTSRGRDKRYVEQLDLDRFVDEVAALLSRGVALVISLDGQGAGMRYGEPLPASLGLVRLDLQAGPSAQATLLGRRETTVESLYLSPSLARRAQGGR